MISEAEAREIQALVGVGETVEHGGKYDEKALADSIARFKRLLERYATGDRWEAHRANAAAMKRRAEALLQRNGST